MTNNKLKLLIDKLYADNNLERDQLLFLVENIDKPNYNTEENLFDYLCKKSDVLRHQNYDRSVYLRGLIEISNICKKDCYYCGIRASNNNVERYRLDKNSILECCEIGYEIGYRTFVLQGGEDQYFTDEIMSDIIRSIKTKYPDCAITLSIGEKSIDSYKKYYESGADRYLLRHETSTTDHYSKLHPDVMKLENRVKCLNDLKKIGFQVGAGFMVGSPYQTDNELVSDLLFLKEFNPHMVGIGPFIPHIDTKFKDYKHGDLRKTILMLAITRLLLPKCLLPATTALASIDPNGRKQGLKSGCNVIMPNLSPKEFRKQYSLYNNKLSTGKEAFEYHKELEISLELLGLKVDYSRGDNIEWRRL